MRQDSQRIASVAYLELNELRHFSFIILWSLIRYAHHTRSHYYLTDLARRELCIRCVGGAGNGLHPSICYWIKSPDFIRMDDIMSANDESTICLHRAQCAIFRRVIPFFSAKLASRTVSMGDAKSFVCIWKKNPTSVSQNQYVQWKGNGLKLTRAHSIERCLEGFACGRYVLPHTFCRRFSHLN